MRWKWLLLVVLLLVAIWVAAVFFPELLWFAELLTALAVGTPVVVLLGLWVRDRLERSRVANVTAPVGGRKRRERAETRKVLGRLIAEQRRVRGGRLVADRMPWYLVLGPPASGKSLMLERLGLSLLRIPPHTQAVERPRLDLWCSSEAVFAEVAANALDDGKRESWTLLLAELRRARGVRPVEGVLVTLDVADLKGPADTVAADFARQLHARIDEAVDILGLVLPVYVIVLKADALEGFTEFWAEDPVSRETTWGASFGRGDDVVSEPGKAVRREFEVLAKTLHARLLERIVREGDPQRRIRVLRFPAEFRRIEAPLARFVEALCRAGPAPERFVLRGFYLASAGEAASRGRFLTDLLGSVVLPDRYLAAPTARAAGARTGREAVLSGVAVGGLVLLLVPAIVSYVHNVQLARAVEAAGLALGNTEAESTPGTQGDPIEPAVDALARMDADWSAMSLPGWFSPRAARELLDPLDELYLNRVHAWMLQNVRPELERKLDAIALGPPLADAPSAAEDRTPLLEAYETVKLCATLAEPKGHLVGGWAAKQLAEEWRKLLPDQKALSRERLTEHTSRYLSGLEKRPALAWSFPGKLADARSRLRQLEVRDMAYRRLLRHGQGAPPVRASDLFGPASLEFLDSRGDVQVSGVYTQNGWQKIRDALASSAPWPRDSVVDGWVLEDPDIPEERALGYRMREHYFDDFAERWMRFLVELRVRTPKDLDTARRELTAFKAEGFYRVLFAQLKLNLIRDEPATGDAGVGFHLPWFGKAETDAAAAPAAMAVERAFRPLLVFSGEDEGTKPEAGAPAPLEKYLAILDSLKGDLGDSPSPKISPDDVRSHLLQAKAGVRELLDAVPESSRRTLAQLLLPPIMGGVAAGTSEGQRSLSDDWKSVVWEAWNEGLNGHFPFRAAPSARPANFADFAKFFRPDADGVLWGFVQAHLMSMVEQTGDRRYVPRSGVDALAPEALTFLTKAQEVTDAFFHAGEDPGLELSVQADWTSPDVTDAQFVLGSKGTALPKAQWSVPIRWFGEDVRVEWKESGRAVQQLGRHAFSLFDLFSSLGGLKGLSGTVPLYSADCSPLTLKLRPEGKDALRPDFFARVHCPQDLRVSP